MLPEDRGAEHLVSKLLAGEQFNFVRVGDGVLFLVYGASSYGRGELPDANGIIYKPEVGERTRAALFALSRWPHTIVGEPPIGAEIVATLWDHLEAELGYPPTVPTYSLEHCRTSRQVQDFFKILAADTRTKVYVGPAEHAGAAKMLRADLCPIPLGQEFQDSWEAQEQVADELNRSGASIIVYAAAHAAKFIMAHCSNDKRTQVDIGTSLDTLFGPPTRRNQLSTPMMQFLYAELLRG